MDEKNIISNSIKATPMDIISPAAALDNLKLTKREDGKSFNLEVNYGDYVLKGIIALNCFRIDLKEGIFPILSSEASGFMGFDFLQNGDNVLITVEMKNTEDD